MAHTRNQIPRAFCFLCREDIGIAHSTPLVGSQERIELALMIFQRGSPLTAPICRTLLQVVLGRVCQAVEDIAYRFPVLQVFRSHHWCTWHQVHCGRDQIEGIAHANHVGIGYIGPQHRVLYRLRLQCLVVVILKESVLFYRPSLALQDSTVLAHEHLLRLSITLQLPLQPSQGSNCELTTMGLTIGTAMPYGEVDGTGRHVVNAVEVIHAVLVGNIFLTTQQIHNGSVNLLQFLLRRHRHTAYSLMGVLLIEETTIADHQSLDALISTVKECLQSTARHTCHADILQVDLLIVGRLRVSILSESPVDALDLLLCTAHRPPVILVHHRDDTRSKHEESVRGNLVQKVHVLPGRVGASTITPHQHRKRLLSTEGREVLRRKHGVLSQSGHFGHYHLIGTCTPVFNDSRLRRLLSTHHHSRSAKHV